MTVVLIRIGLLHTSGSEGFSLVQAPTEGFQYKLQLVDDNIQNVIREEYAYNRGMHIESPTVATRSRPEQALQRQGSDPMTLLD